ncbi:MAG: hypothetical protein FI707_10110 [SAR202 cluster bacterium]|nr:hypothetical protein [Chloroflexota bacterium]MDP6422868.1 hypothetical protein [SAR202 cluster bacterium]HAL46976.1 hypothetical protein [Dehalococcoidia bacterium]MDP6665446.1 hypothetical protein [SAR202 cluster bacterium]MDP6798240.1 hypothetical protein [SAR202 cluster bacterium]
MTRSNERTATTEAEIRREMERRAAELWGESEAHNAHESVVSAAANVWRLANHLPDFEEEPGFYF